MNKIILVERDASRYANWKNLALKNKIQGLSVEQVATKYKGFEGEILEVYEVNENDNDLKNHMQELLELKNLSTCFLMYIQASSTPIPSYVELNGLKLGYDVGVCAEEEEEEEDEVYSSIFHEILFGEVEELIKFKEILNDNFLFNDRLSAEKYVKVHNEMAALGKDVEDYMPMVIYEIWKLE